MDKQELIKKILSENRWSQVAVRSIIDSIEEEGWLRNPGERIVPEDIEVGDKVRRIYPNGDETMFVAKYPISGLSSLGTFFLLERPETKYLNISRDDSDS